MRRSEDRRSGRAPEALQVGAELTLDVEALDEHGAGTATLSLAEGSWRVHVPGALPGEQARVEVEHLSPHRPEVWTSLLAIERPSCSRVSPPCPRFGVCGGCSLQHLALPGQLEAKRAQVLQALAAHLPAGAGCPVAEVLPSPRSHGYRAFAKYVVARGAEGPILASYRPRTHDPVDMAPCTVIEPSLGELGAAHLRLLSEVDLPLRYLLLRAAHDATTLAVWVCRQDPGPSANQAAAELLRLHGGLRGVVLHVNDAAGDGLFDREGPTRVLAGVDHLEEQVGPIRLRVSARSFFQINREQAARLYQTAARLAEPRRHEVVADLYAGVGGLALTLGLEAGQVVGLELEPGAVADAEAGAAATGLTAARFRAGDAASWSACFPDVPRADIVVLNPPRKGCSPQALQAALSLSPSRLVYVSCSPATLARDLGSLAEAGYRPVAIQPVDLFPQTSHVETVVLLNRPT